MRLKFRIPFILPLFAFLGARKSKVGGQAVLEGVMMRGKGNVSWAVRKNDREVVVERIPFISICRKYKPLARPVFRGAVSLFESLILGYRALTRSAEIVEEEMRSVARAEGKRVKESNRTGERIASGFALFVSLLIALGLFMYLPMWIISRYVPRDSALLFNLLSGATRILFFLGYLLFISMWKEMKRFFEYHGAEHMAIYTHEDGLELTLGNMRRYSTLHPRCGTSFILLVGFVCMLLFAVVDALYISFFGPYPLVLVRFAVHIFLVPVVSGLSFEVLRLSDRYRNVPPVGFLIKPGLWLQKITTKRPDDAQLEVAAKALRAAL